MKKLILAALLTMSFASNNAFAFGGGCDERDIETLSALEARVVSAVKASRAKFDNLKEPSSQDEKSRDGVAEYDSVANRPIEDLVKDPKFENCTSAARLVAHELAQKSGVRIVSGVQTDEHMKICYVKDKDWTYQTAKWLEVIKQRKIETSGHDVILVKRYCTNEWYWVNPRDVPSEVKLVKAEMNPDDLSLKIETEPRFIPNEVLAAQGRRLKKTLGKDPYKDGVLIFNVRDKGQMHSFQERLNMIASGTRKSAKCRYALTQNPGATQKSSRSQP